MMIHRRFAIAGHFLIALAAATAMAVLLKPVLPVGGLALVFVTAVVWLAARTGVYAGLLASVVSFLVYNFGFTEPRFTFHITNPDELATVLFFLLVAVIVGHLAGRLRTQLEAERRARVAEETERLRSAMLSSISHDLRTPLSSMIGSASSLLSLHDQMSEEDRTSLLEAILAEGQRLDRYIRNLLDMTRLGHGTLKIERDWIAVTDLLASALRRTRKVLEDVDVRLRIDDNLPLIYVHPALIEQALVNILENAGRYAPAGTVVTISAAWQDHHAVLVISDQGAGIPEHLRQRVFERFFTGDSGPHADQGGTGLGLAISQGLVRAHGGEVLVVEPESGEGARFEIRLPVDAASRTDDVAANVSG
ncbi:DUF4118 domain-containing protein [Marinobacter lacisalsi]|uniref:histidine kinase n=1 Tax=Marinobacter lacisalsi TaxID=475979 RepID=A0ABV8QJD6_9GAMM